MKAIYMYTASDGHSHFKIGQIVCPAVFKTTTTKFAESAPFSVFDWHNAPCTQFVLTLKGTLQFTMHSGSTFILSPGTVLIAEDTTGSGHKWELINDEPWQRVYCVYNETLKIVDFFKEDN